MSRSKSRERLFTRWFVGGDANTNEAVAADFSARGCGTEYESGKEITIAGNKFRVWGFPTFQTACDMVKNCRSKGWRAHLYRQRGNGSVLRVDHILVPRRRKVKQLGLRRASDLAQPPF